MPYCQECGQEHHPDAEFCPRCGGAVTAGETEAARRSYMKYAVGGVVALSGLGGAAVMLSGMDGQHQNAGEEAWADRDRFSTATSNGIRGQISLEEGQYTAYEWEVQSARLAIAVNTVDAGQLDVWTIADADIQRYQNAEDDVPFVESISKRGIDGETVVSGTLSAGTYWTVIDNTPKYGAEPNGTVTADVGIGVGL